MSPFRRFVPAVRGVALAGALAVPAEAQVPTDLLFKDGLECAVLPAASVGCEFYAVPLLNTLDSPDNAFAVFLRNTAPFQTATVSISGGGLATPQSFLLGDSEAAAIPLPWVDGLQAAGASARADGASYHIVSDRPLTAHQVNAYGGPLTLTSSDASLLLPVHALGRNHHVVSWPSWMSFPGYFAVVAAEDATSVTVVPRTPVLAGGGLSDLGGTVTLSRGDVLQVVAPTPGDPSYGADLSGSVVTADKPIAVFGGHDATHIPAGVGYADHLEEQIPPDETLGTEFIVAVPARTVGVNRHVVKITGLEGTSALTYAPPLPGAPTSVSSGSSVMFTVTVDFRIISSQPILVSQYLEGNDAVGSGDPAMGLVVPSSQFQSRHAFVTPLNFTETWITVVGPVSATASVNGGAVAFAAIPGTSVGVARVMADLGTTVHDVTASLPVGVYLHGFGSYVSYLSPAGMGLTGVPPDPSRIRPWSFAAIDGGDLSVTTAAALNNTTYGLQAFVDDTAGLFLQDDTPAGEDRYRARFYFDPNGFDPGEAQGHRRTRIFIAFAEGSRRVLAVVLRRLNGQYSLMVRARLDDNTQANTTFVPISDGPHVVEVALTRSSGPDAADGSVSLQIDDEPEVGRGGLDNSQTSVDFVRMGALSVKAGANGTMYWDEFESRRSSLIGP